SRRTAPVTFSTPGPISARRARCWATSRPSVSRTGFAAPSSSSVRSRSPIRVLRVIARLNMGGPALHVAYLSAGLRERGYETTLVAGSLARGEESMSFVADSLGVPIVTIEQLHRE